MGYGLKQLEPATVEPIDEATAMRHLIVVDADEGPYIRDVLIPAARQRAEHDTGRQLLTATWQLSLPSFPCGAIALPKGVVQSVEQISYVDQAGDEQILDDESYRLLDDREPAEVEPVDYWPVAHPRRRDAVKIKFKAGYGDDGTSVPPLLIKAMLQTMAHWYQNREEVVVGLTATAVPQSAASVYERFRVGDDFIDYEGGV